ncbi:MAG: hypothetical protein AAGK67_13695 [Pseudomonadota bacterium]
MKNVDALIMTFTRDPQTIRADRCKARAKRARGLSRVVTLALFGLGMTVIWREPELAPSVHDGMRASLTYALEFANNQDGNGYLTAMANFGLNGADAAEGSEDPITDALRRLADK